MVLYDNIPGKSGLAGCPLDSQFPVILMGQVEFKLRF